MELQLTEGIEFIIDDNSNIELPSYVTRLNPSDVCRETERSKLIVAAGTDPHDQRITLVTGNGRILVFDAPKYYIPSGPSKPVDGGKQIFFQNIEGRWHGNSPGFFANADWIIEKSETALAGATLRVNYPHENNSR